VQIELLCVEDAVEVGDDSGDSSGDFVGVEVVACIKEGAPDLTFLVTTAW
jgi:hypothetical protein